MNSIVKCDWQNDISMILVWKALTAELSKAREEKVIANWRKRKEKKKKKNKEAESKLKTERKQNLKRKQEAWKL